MFTLASILLTIVVNFWDYDYNILTFVKIFSLGVDAKFGVNVIIDINDYFNISLNIEVRLTLRDETCDGIVVLLQYEWLSHFEHIPCYMSLMIFNSVNTSLFCNTTPFAPSSFVMLIFNSFNVSCNISLNVSSYKFDFKYCCL